MAATDFYERRIVAYADIIGWSEACRSDVPDELLRVANAAQGIHDAAHQYSVPMKERISLTPNALIHPKFTDTQWGAFSDNFAISMPESFGHRLLSLTADICRRLLRLGFLTRGAITVGDLHHVDNVVYGPAIVEAVRLEGEAVYPRIVVSPSALQSLESWSAQDDNHNFIDAFCRQPLMTDPLGRIVANILAYGKNVDELDSTRSKHDVANQLWGVYGMASHIQQAIQRWSELRDDKKLEKWTYMNTIFRQALKPLYE